MAFKRSGVRLPLAPPLSELHFNGLCANKFRGSFKERIIKRYKGLLPNCGCVADRKSSRRAANLPLRRRAVTSQPPVIGALWRSSADPYRESSFFVPTEGSEICASRAA